MAQWQQRRGTMTAERQSGDYQLIIVHRGKPLIGLPGSAGDDEDLVAYFADEDEADETVTDVAVEAVLALAGAWSDVPWEELEAGLDRIRHESEPTPPIEL
jgi:hypothetical protein